MRRQPWRSYIFVPESRAVRGGACLAFADMMNDDIWILRCIERMVELDPALQPVHAGEVASDLCTRERWRAMAPEVAAQAVFDIDAKR